MKIDVKKTIDYYVGGFFIFLARPLVRMIGRILRVNHDSEPRGDIVIIKMLGGGSLIIAFPTLLGIKRRYPHLKLKMVTSPGVRPFAEVLGLFDEIIVVNDRSLVTLIVSGFKTWLKVLRSDTVIDLEVYSRLSCLFATAICARNRIGFYLESAFWRHGLHTHLIFFNRYSSRHQFYEQMGRCIGAEPCSLDDVETHLRKRFKSPKLSTSNYWVIGHACSDLSQERMISVASWKKHFSTYKVDELPAKIYFLGAPGDDKFASQIIQALQPICPATEFINHCGKSSLAESIEILGHASHFVGIDSALLHCARSLGIPSVSFWGPTDPSSLAQPRPGYSEKIHYLKVSCSPCVHVTETPPCFGNNVCVQNLFLDESKRNLNPHWLVR